MARPAETDAASKRVLEELERRELLLQAGREFASVANLVTGEEIRGSWWAHPRSNLIYWVCQDLEAHPRVAEARLLAGKVTHLWQTLWPHVAAIALAREPWQLEGLSGAALRLLARVDEQSLRTDTLDWTWPREKKSDVCRLLERRLLVNAQEFHTDSGKHAKLLVSWRVWWNDHGGERLPDPEHARAYIERRVDGECRLLPWHSSRRARARDSYPF